MSNCGGSIPELCKELQSKSAKFDNEKDKTIGRDAVPAVTAYPLGL